MKTYKVYAKSTTELSTKNKRSFDNRPQAINYANNLLNKFKINFANEYRIARQINYTKKPISLSAKFIKSNSDNQIIKLTETAANNTATIHFEKAE